MALLLLAAGLEAVRRLKEIKQAGLRVKEIRGVFVTGRLAHQAVVVAVLVLQVFLVITH